MDFLPLQQSRAYADALQRLGRMPRWVDNETARMLVISRGTTLTSRGPLWRTQDAGEQTVFLRRFGPRIVNADRTPHAVLRGAGYRQVITAATVAVLSRSSPAHPKWDASRRCSHELSLSTEALGTQHTELLQQDRSQQKQRRYRGLPPGFINAMSPDLEVHIARLQDRIVAWMIFARHPPTATYLMGCTTPDGRRSGAHHALLHRARTALASDVTDIDLGTIDTETAPGLARFKLRSGARVHQLGGTWLRVPGL